MGTRFFLFSLKQILTSVPAKSGNLKKTEIEMQVWMKKQVERQKDRGDENIAWSYY